MILIVGDGNFSYSLSFVRKLSPALGNSTIATSFEDEVTCFQKYGEKARSNLLSLKELGSLVFHGIDATCLEAYPAIGGIHKFKQVIFNFPHTGRKANIKLNRALLSKFFKSASKVLEDEGKVEVTLCAGQGGTPEDSKQREKCNHWQIVDMATHGGFILQNVQNFVPIDGYLSTGRRGAGNIFHTEGAKTHIFIKSPSPPNLSDDWSSSALLYETTELPSSLNRRLKYDSGTPRLPQQYFSENICDKLKHLVNSSYDPCLSEVFQNHLQKSNFVQINIKELGCCPKCAKVFENQICSFKSQQNNLLTVFRPSLALEVGFVMEKVLEFPETVSFCAAAPVFTKPTANKISSLCFEMMIIGKSKYGKNAQELSTCDILNILSILFDERNVSLCVNLKPVCRNSCNNDEHLHLCDQHLPTNISLPSNIHVGLVYLLHLAADYKIDSLEIISIGNNATEMSHIVGYTCSFVDKSTCKLFLTIIDMDILSCLLLNGLDTKNQQVLWSLCKETQRRLFDACLHNIPYKSNSLFPPKYVLHISFWILDSSSCNTEAIIDEKRMEFTEERFLQILSYTCDDLIKAVKLVDKYIEQSTNSASGTRTSLCYEMVYSSHEYCFYKTNALQLQELVAKNVSKYLKVMIR